MRAFCVCEQILKSKEEGATAQTKVDAVVQCTPRTKDSKRTADIAPSGHQCGQSTGPWRVLLGFGLCRFQLDRLSIGCLQPGIKFPGISSPATTPGRRTEYLDLAGHLLQIKHIHSRPCNPMSCLSCFDPVSRYPEQPLGQSHASVPCVHPPRFCLLHVLY
ncbi:hypothetical protein EJ03DRAFT_73032 [Teratosphaeria nubilosa]|uniref:Uncharacterized protein n=1 Tax=Teratosphaeria nubilosa TaxID=161662 RepID=A0A6G1LN21_9PEZI|nr:hypothetical protein EJ03DRAFT_73032 [Teratosphaeria nubilosa]